MGVRHLLACAPLLLVASAVAAGTPPQPIPSVTVAPTTPSLARVPTTMTWTIDGVARLALVFAPAPAPGIAVAKRPLIFAFHGHGGTMQGTAKLMHLQTLWPGAVVVYPQGLKGPSHVDPMGHRAGWQTIAGDSGDRDLKLFDAMLVTLRQTYPIDDSRIYTTGFSNGAIFSYLLWATRGAQLAAVGACAGGFLPPTAPSEPRAVVHVGGTADTTMPFSNQQEAIDTDRQVDHAQAPGSPCGQGCTLYPSTTQTPVETLIHSGGHLYPPWASAAIVKFFQAHAKP